MTCDKPLCAKDGLYGCGGRLCRNMRHTLSRMIVTRGDISGELCGFITLLPVKNFTENYAIAGIRADKSSVRLTVITSTFPLQVGDIVEADGRKWAIEMPFDDNIRYCLRAVEEEEEDDDGNENSGQ